MGFLYVFFILFSGKIILSAPTNGPNSKFFDELTKTCTSFNFSQQAIIKECYNAAAVEIDSITDQNKETVLCTIYSHNLLALNKTLNNSTIICNESLLFPKEESYKENICNTPEFLISSTSNLTKELLILRCTKVCLDFDEKIHPKCGLAFYYNKLISSKLTTPATVLNLNQVNNSILIAPTNTAATDITAKELVNKKEENPEKEKNNNIEQLPTTKIPVVMGEDVGDEPIFGDDENCKLIFDITKYFII